jgi:hypothetical protein
MTCTEKGESKKAFDEVLFLALILPSSPAQTPADAGPGWPQKMDAFGFHLVIYQPQVDHWKKDHLDARGGGRR